MIRDENLKKSTDYAKGMVNAAYRVLGEIVNLLAPYEEDMRIVGGWVPYLLYQEQDHIGSIDVDVLLNQQKIRKATSYENIKRILLRNGWIRFAVVAKSRKDAAKKARMFGRVKHDHQDAIGYVKEIDFESFMVLKAENDADPYLHCKSKREQNQIEGFSARIEPDEFNIAKRQKKNTRNAEYKLRKSRCAEYDAKRKIFEYYGIA